MCCLAPADDLLTLPGTCADELKTAVRYSACVLSKGTPAGTPNAPQLVFNQTVRKGELKMFSIAISGVLFLAQAIPFIKPLIEFTLTCSGGSHCGG